MLTFNIDGAIAHVDGMLARMANMQPVMGRIGADQRNEVMDRILDAKHSPDGEAWAPWSPRRLMEREEKGNPSQGLLWDTGTLVHSILARDTAIGVEIGTDVPYAYDLQHGHDGFEHMPPRPFLGWSAEGKQTAEHLVVRYLEGINL